MPLVPTGQCGDALTPKFSDSSLLREVFMRKLFAFGFTAFCLTALSAQFAAAQEPMSETMLRPRVPVEPRETRSMGMIRDQAITKAQLRMARMEGRKWLGLSGTRPVYDTAPFNFRQQSWRRYGYWNDTAPIYGPIYGPYVER
jgi:hypothetical protein